jgi:hypothetical protein
LVNTDKPSPNKNEDCLPPTASKQLINTEAIWLIGDCGNE